MELKFLLLVISLIFSVQSKISNKNVVCNFKVQNKVYKDESDKHYGCLLSFSKNENSEELLGVHLPGKNDDDVEFVHSQMRQTRLPKRLSLKFCEKFKNLKIISINRRDIEEIDENIIESCHNLTEFSLTSNSVRVIPENLFSKNTKLKSINLNNNEIEILPANLFKTLTNLETLFIGRNKLKQLNPDWFTNLLNLKEFSAERNELTVLQKGIFKPLKNLVGLHLFNNNLTIIHSDSFFLPSNLKQLSLSHNQIKAIDRKLLNESSISKVYMYPNVCNNSNMVFREETLMGLKRCFNNYQPREE